MSITLGNPQNVMGRWTQKPTAPFIEKGGDRGKSLPDRLNVNHSPKITAVRQLTKQIQGLPGIEWVIGEIIGREKLVDSGLSAL